MFGLFNEPNAEADTYIVSPFTNFPFTETQLLTILFSGSGNPLLGLPRGSGGGEMGGVYEGPNLGPFLGRFEETDPGTWSFSGSSRRTAAVDEDAALFQQVEGISKESQVAEEGLEIQWGRPHVGSAGRESASQAGGNGTTPPQSAGASLRPGSGRLPWPGIVVRRRPQSSVRG